MDGDLRVSFVTVNPGAGVDFEAGRQAIEELAARPLSFWPWGFPVEVGIDPDMVSEDGDDPADLRAELVEELKADLADLEAAFQGKRRDVWIDRIGQKGVVLTGGPSRGQRTRRSVRGV
jgi:hypothetical protein